MYIKYIHTDVMYRSYMLCTYTFCSLVTQTLTRVEMIREDLNTLVTGEGGVPVDTGVGVAVVSEEEREGIVVDCEDDVSETTVVAGVGSPVEEIGSLDAGVSVGVATVEVEGGTGVDVRDTAGDCEEEEVRGVVVTGAAVRDGEEEEVD